MCLCHKNDPQLKCQNEKMPKEKSLIDFLEATLFITNQNPKLDRELRVHSLVTKDFMEYLEFHVEKIF